MAITRDDVIQTAIQLLQEVGLDGLTLRRLATELGISAPTLYWHVRDKRELLDLMAEEMIRAQRAKDPPLPAHLSWDEVIAESIRRQYRAIINYRDGARVIAGNRPTDAALPMIEAFLARWVEAGFAPDEALATILTLGDFVAGSALEYQSEQERRREQSPETLAAIWKKMEPFPMLHAAATRRAQHRRAMGASDSFEHGLSLMMAGLRARHIQLQAEKQKATPEARPKAKLG